MLRILQLSASRGTCCLAFYAARFAHMRHGRRRRSENYYDVLNIPSNSTNKEIKEAFIELSKKYHPDANTSTCNTEQFMRVCEAYQILHKESLRNQYDSRLQQPLQQRADTSYATNNVYKSWQQYQTAMRNKQQGHSFKINKSSSGGGILREKPLPFKSNRTSRWVPALAPNTGLGVIESHHDYHHHNQICGSATFTKSDGGNDTEKPSEWSFSCLVAGFGLVSGLLFMDNLSDWCNKKPPDTANST